ncbi:MAG: WG repeat-containing protein [Abditibacteriota bacterium]|nr:WG repeat-containing protein [Abditibacteriota bacterium]
MKIIKIIFLFIICVFLLGLICGIFYVEKKYKLYFDFGSTILIDVDSKKQINKYYWFEEYCKINDFYYNAYYKTYYDKYFQRNEYLYLPEIKTSKITFRTEGLKKIKIKDNLYGYCDYNNKIIFKSSSNYYMIEKANNYLIIYNACDRGLLDLNGNVIIPINKENIAYIGDNNFIIKEQGKKYIFDAKDKKAVFDATHLGLLSDGLIPFSKDGENYGYVDINGKIVIPPMYTFAGNFSEGIAMVAKGRGLWYQRIGYVNTNNEIIIPIKYLFGRDCIDGKVLVTNISLMNHIHKLFELLFFEIYLLFH